MKAKVIVENFGEAEKEGLFHWYVENHSAVVAGQELGAISTDKAVMVVFSPCNGTINRCVKEGAIVEVGDLLCYIINIAP